MRWWAGRKWRWHKKFAWWPIKICGRYVWFEYYRRRIIRDTDDARTYEVELIDKKKGGG